MERMHWSYRDLCECPAEIVQLLVERWSEHGADSE